MSAVMAITEGRNRVFDTCSDQRSGRDRLGWKWPGDLARTSVTFIEDILFTEFVD
jgi:hypothetical protein